MMTAVEAICLALVLYHEARDQPIDGQVAVAEVVVNRVADPRYGDDICTVTTEPHQFAWQGEPDDMNAWLRALIVARAILQDPEGTLPTTGATHYHTVNSHPWWTIHMTRLRTVDDHIFYQEE